MLPVLEVFWSGCKKGNLQIFVESQRHVFVEGQPGKTIIGVYHIMCACIQREKWLLFALPVVI